MHNRSIKKKSSPLMRKVIKSMDGIIDRGLVSKKNMLSLNDSSLTEVAVDREQIFDLILKNVRHAKKQVVIQTFVWDKNIPFVKDLRQALCDASKNKLKRLTSGENPDIHVFIYIDERGSAAEVLYNQKYPHKVSHDPASLGLGDLPDNIKVHVGVHRHNNFDSSHAKVVLIDSDTLILSGANFQFSNYGANPNYDAGLLLQGPVALGAFESFKHIWDRRTNVSEEEITPQLPDTTIKKSRKKLESHVPVLYVTSKLRPASVYGFFASTKNPPADPINNAFIALLKNAKKTLRIATPNLNVLKFIQELADFINLRDGRVELVLSKNFNDSREAVYGGTNAWAVKTLMQLITPEKQNHIRIKWYARNGKLCNEKKEVSVMHMKYMCADDQVTIFGSANLDKVSIYNCHETNVVIDDSNFAKQSTKTLFAKIFSQGIPATDNLQDSLIHCPTYRY